MNEETLIYYNKKISMLGLSKCTREYLRSNLKNYYEYFKIMDGQENIENKMITTFALGRNEAKYVYILCKVHYLTDVHRLPPTPIKVERDKKNIRFNDINEWAKDRAKRGRKFKEVEFYKYLVENYCKYRQKDLIKIIENRFDLVLPGGYLRKVWEDYFYKVEVKVI